MKSNEEKILEDAARLEMAFRKARTLQEYEEVIRTRKKLQESLPASLNGDREKIAKWLLPGFVAELQYWRCAKNNLKNISKKEKEKIKDFLENISIFLEIDPTKRIFQTYSSLLIAAYIELQEFLPKNNRRLFF